MTVLDKQVLWMCKNNYENINEQMAFCRKVFTKEKIFALTVRTYFHMLKREIEAVKICAKT